MVRIQQVEWTSRCAEGEVDVLRADRGHAPLKGQCRFGKPTLAQAQSQRVVRSKACRCMLDQAPVDLLWRRTTYGES